MGACFSQDHSPGFQTAEVISLNGELNEYKLPITVGRVLVLESFSFSLSSFVRCNSDKLCYEDYVPALEPTERLVEIQIYFVLPRSRLLHKLTAPDMAALAVKASAAMQEAAKKGGARRRSTRTLPVIEVVAAKDETEGLEVQETISGGLERTASARPLQSSSFIRLKKGAQSFRDYARDNLRTLPVIEVVAAEDETEGSEVKETNSGGLERTATARPLQSSSSRRLKKGAQSFRVRLSTIQEGSFR